MCEVPERKADTKWVKPRTDGASRPAFAGKKIKDRYASQNYQRTIAGIRPVIPKRVVQKHGRSQHEQARNHRISPNTIWAWRTRFTPAEEENGASGDHVKQPFGKNCQRKELTKTASEKQQ